MMRILFVFLLALAAAGAHAQPGKQGGRERQMSQEDRQRMRDDVRDAYRNRGGPPAKARQMSPAERDQLRRDIQDANRQIKR